MSMIPATASVIVVAVSYFFTKKKERDADWRKYKFEQYKEFLGALSRIVGQDETPEGHSDFARATNTLHLIGSKGVLKALHAYRDEISASNANNRSSAKHDALLSMLICEIRRDVGIPRTPESDEFVVRLYCSSGTW